MISRGDQPTRDPRRDPIALDPAKPGLIDSLRGAGGEPWRIFVTVALCVIGVLLVTGLIAVIESFGA
jgi:hypothetical protein